MNRQLGSLRVVLCLGALLAAFGCVRETRDTVVVVRPQNLDAGTRTLRIYATLDNDRSAPVDSTRLDEVDLRLASGTIGRVKIDVRAMDSKDNALSRGIVEVDVTGIGRYEVDVPLVPVLATIIGGGLAGVVGIWQQYLGKRASCGLYRMFVIEGTDPEAPILDSSTEDLLLPLPAGTHQLTFLGTSQDSPPWRSEIGSIDRQGMPQFFLKYTSDTPMVSQTVGTVTLTSKSFTVQSVNSDRVGDCDVRPDGMKDTMGSLTVEVSGTP